MSHRCEKVACVKERGNSFVVIPNPSRAQNVPMASTAFTLGSTSLFGVSNLRITLNLHRLHILSPAFLCTCAQKGRCWGRLFGASSWRQLKSVISAFGRSTYLWLTRRTEEIQPLIQGDTFPNDEIILLLLLNKYIFINIWGAVFKYLVSIPLIYMPIG